MEKRLCLAVLAVVTGGAASADDMLPGLTSDTLLPPSQQASRWTSPFADPTLTGAALRAIGYRALGTVGLNPDHMGPVGCGYHAMIDTIGTVTDKTGAGAALRSGIAMWGGAMDLRSQLCPITDILNRSAGSWTDGFGLLHPDHCETPDAG